MPTAESWYNELLKPLNACSKSDSANKGGSTMKKWISVIGAILLSLSFTTYAQQSGGGGDIENTCAVSGGTWTGSEGGNWACCWADWGCYGCVDGICKIKCHNQRCRDANGITRPSASTIGVDGLAPKGMKAPVIPKPKVTPKATVTPKTMQ